MGHSVKDNLPALIPVVILVLGGIGFLIKRYITGQHHREHAESIEKTLQVKKLLDESGLTIDEAIKLRDVLNGAKQHSETLLKPEYQNPNILSSDDVDDTSLEVYSRTSKFETSTVGMDYKLSCNLRKIEADLEFAIADLHSVCSEARSEALEKAQKAWELFRAREAKFASLLFEGGTGAPILAGGKKIELTERRLNEVRAERDEVRNLTGE
jgi:uncharacterized protein YecT (DUF1311 family)